MKKLIVLSILLLMLPCLVLAQSDRPVNYLGTTTRGQGGQYYTNIIGSDGSTAQVIGNPSGTVVITQQPGFDYQDREFDALHKATQDSIKKINPGTRTILDDD